MILVLQSEDGTELCRRAVSESQVVQQAATELIDAEMAEIATRHSKLSAIKKDLTAPTTAPGVGE